MKDTPIKVEVHGVSNQFEDITYNKGNMSGISTLAKFKAAQDVSVTPGLRGTKC